MILDTNAFFIPFQFNINLDAELERTVGSYNYIIPSSVEDELRGLASGGEKFAREALSLLEHLSPEVVPGSGVADQDVIALARERSGAVVTQDAVVRKRAKAAGIPVIFLRSGKHLVLSRPGLG